MNAFISISLTPHGLELRCPAAKLSEDRPLTTEDIQRLQGWAKDYLAETGKTDRRAALLAIGQQMHDWCNGPESFLIRALETATAPLLIEWVVSRQQYEQEAAQALLNAPWELLASDGEFWALDPGKVFCPIRRLGKAAPPPGPSPTRLGLVFMAAAPRGADNLDYEAEEASILAATRHLGLELAVEESGTLELLSACVARETPEVIQISCHGTLHPRPGLLLEDDVGDADFVEAQRLYLKLAARHPRLLFLSACETAQADPVLPSLARSLVGAGASAVLGWAAPVLDLEATLFASCFYQRLTAGEDLAHALAYARFELASHDRLAPDGSHDWHLARLFLSPGGGGAFATAGGPQRHLGQGQAVKCFLDAKGKQVPVAGPLEFVGRRREIQRILREFRAPVEDRHAGVFIHGVGRQGKSSLAARLAHRLEHTHETVVVFGRYDAPFILRTLGERLPTPAVTEIVQRHLPQVEADPAALRSALTELLEGPSAQAGDHGSKPVLLVLDDFERALDEENRRTLKPDYFASVRALLLAFATATTDSHLLFTGRFQFTCPYDGKDLADADHLLDVPLHGMNEREAHKQAQAKLRLPDLARRVAKLPRDEREALDQRLARAITNARGNPGLQDLLFTLAVQDPAGCDQCMAQMEQFLRSGQLPAEEAVRRFLEGLALEVLIGLLSPPQRELLRASTLFELPVPVAVMSTVAEAVARCRDVMSAGAPNSASEGAGGLPPRAPEPRPADWKSAIQQTGNLRYQEDLGRLLALGLWEVYEDLHDPRAPALAVNALARPLAGTLTGPEQAALAGAVTAALFESWGGATGGKRRGYLQDHELTRLGLLARDATVLASTGADALRFLATRFQYQQAAAWSKEILAIVDAASVPASVDLLRTAAERCQQVGEVAEAGVFRERALKLLGSGSEVDTVQQAATLLTHARALVEQGQPDEAQRHLKQAKELLPPGREQAIVLGEIARIWTTKGEVDEALQSYHEVMRICDELGETKGRAVTLGDTARLQAAKGEVDEALRLHQEKLGIVEGLGDKWSRAVTLGDIARLRAAKGEVDEALRLHQEELAVYEGLGDKRSRAVTLGDIARLRAAKGEVDEALRLHQEELAVYEGLGDKRSRAVTLGDIARLRAA